MSLVNRIKTDSVQAMKDKDKFKLSTLRMLVAELEKEKVAHKLTEVSGLSDAQAEEVIRRQVKKLDKEKEAYVKAGVLSDSQDKEKDILLKYLPKQMTEEEIRKAVDATIFTQKSFGRGMGDVMKVLSINLKGKADMGLVSKIAKELFNKGE
jgi:uncharacterized protein